MQTKPAKETVARTPNSDCPACKEKRVHTDLEWKLFHLLAGTGSIVDVKI